MAFNKSLFAIFISLLVLLALSLGVFFHIVENEKKISEKETRRYKSYILADQLRQTSDDLTRMARTYVVTGDKRYKEYFQKILDIRNGKIPRPLDYHSIYWDFVLAFNKYSRKDGPTVSLKDLMKEMGFTDSEFYLLRESELESNKLAQLENEAMNALERFNEESARMILHGYEYHQAKGKIMRPIEYFFKAIDKRTREEVNLYKEQTTRLHIVLGTSMSLTFILVFVSMILIFLSNKIHKKEQVTNVSFMEFVRKNLWSHWPFAIAALVAVCIILGFSWWFITETRTHAYNDLKEEMELNLNATHSAFLDWIEQTRKDSLFFARRINEMISSKSFREIQRGKFNNFQKEFTSLGLAESKIFQEYFLLNTKGEVVVSHDKFFFGKHLPLPKNILSELSLPPSYTAFQLPLVTEKDLLSKRFSFAVRLKKGQGILIVVISSETVAPILRRGFLGETGEVYIIGPTGHFASEGRYKEKLIELGLIETENQSRVGLAVNIPNGREMMKTLGVETVLKGHDSRSISHYRNYVGEEVVGLWRWNDTYKFGILAEIAEHEAFKTFGIYKRYTLFGCSFAIFLILSLVALFTWNKLKIHQANEELGRTYTIIKVQKDELARDLMMGQKVQMDMLPLPLIREKFSIDAILRPAKIVSGDFYDFSFTRDEKVYFVVGDVSGKGVPAALFMSTTKAFLGRTLDHVNDVKSLVKNVNDQLSIGNDQCTFVTLVAGLMNYQTGKLQITNAGHNPPYIKKRTGEIINLETTNGPLVGAFSDSKYSEQELQLEDGDTLLIYTDGVTEAQNSRGEFYGENRLQRLLEKQTFQSTKVMVKSLCQDVTKFIEQTKQFDDITLLALRYREKSA